MTFNGWWMRSISNRFSDSTNRLKSIAEFPGLSTLTSTSQVNVWPAGISMGRDFEPKSQDVPQQASLPTMRAGVDALLRICNGNRFVLIDFISSSDSGLANPISMGLARHGRSASNEYPAVANSPIPAKANSIETFLACGISPTPEQKHVRKKIGQ